MILKVSLVLNCFQLSETLPVRKKRKRVTSSDALSLLCFDLWLTVNKNRYIAFCLSVNAMLIFSSVRRLSVPVTLIFSAA